MQYRAFGKTGMMVSAVGMGANRFKINDLKTEAGLERCAEILVKASNLGVNLFDSATTYSSGKCEEILRLALPYIKSKCYICGKSSSFQERTSDAVIKHIDSSLKRIGVDYFDIYYMWSVKSIDQYEDIMSCGGAYEGALAAKERGLVKHICFSSHASADVTVKIIQGGAFEGVLASYSLLNFHENSIILETANHYGLGVAIMNPLGGGIIAQNPEMFSGALLDGETDVVDSSLKFIYANPAVSTVLCGISEHRELMADVRSLSSLDEKSQSRIYHVGKNMESFSGFCTGCNYCSPCPAGIPVSTMMLAYNQTKFKTDTFIYNRSSEEIIKRGNCFRKLDGLFTFETNINPCIKCGKCEKICTQSLPIIRTIAEIYKWVDENGISLSSRLDRLKSLIHDDYKKVGVYTAGVYTAYIIDFYKKLFKKLNFDIFVFDSNPSNWGSVYLESYIVRNPADIPKLGLDVLLITNYIHSESIYKELSTCYPNENIQKLHIDTDVPWFF